MTHRDWIQVRGEVSPESVSRVREAVGALPSDVVAYLRASGVRLVISKALYDTFPALAGKKPPGYPPGTTYVHAAGVYVGDEKTVAVAETYVDHQTGLSVANSLLAGGTRHEIGHAMNHATGHYSRGKPFVAAHSLDAASIRDRERFAYYLQPWPNGPSEAFAELFAQCFGGGCDDVPLAAAFPRTAARVALLLEILHRFRPNPQR